MPRDVTLFPRWQTLVSAVGEWHARDTHSPASCTGPAAQHGSVVLILCVCTSVSTSAASCVAAAAPAAAAAAAALMDRLDGLQRSLKRASIESSAGPVCKRQRSMGLSLLDMPDELLVGVLSHLPSVRDLLRVEQVCRRLWSVARDPALWRHVLLTDATPEMLNRGLVDAVARRSHSTQSLTFDPATSTDLDASQFAQLLPDSGSLKSITLASSRLRHASLLHLLTTQPALQSIECHFTGDVSGVAQSFLDDASDADMTNIKAASPGPILLSDLSSLTVTLPSPSPEAVLTGIAAPELRQVSIESQSPATDNVLTSLAASAPRLEKLSLTLLHPGAVDQPLAASCTDAGVFALSTRCANLQHFALSCAPALTGAAVLALADNCQWLRVLSLSYCNAIGANLRTPPRFTMLKCLRLYHCADLDDQAVSLVLRGAPNLRGLCLDGCFGVTDAALEHLPSQVQCLNLNQVQVQASGVELVAARLANLQSLVLGNSLSVELDNDPLLHALGDTDLAPLIHTQHLERLSLHSCTLTGAGLSRLLSHHASLRVLKLANCLSFGPGVYDTSAASGVQTLQLLQCPSLQDRDLACLATAMPQLLSLELEECDGITGQAIAHISAASPLLRSLTVTACANIAKLPGLAPMNCLVSFAAVDCPMLSDEFLLLLVQRSPLLVQMSVQFCQRINRRFEFLSSDRLIAFLRTCVQTSAAGLNGA